MTPPPRNRGPRPLAEILGELFAARGLSQVRAASALEEAWNAAVGAPSCRHTRVGRLYRGVLNVTVCHPALLEELAAFRKPALLAALRQALPASTIRDIRFRVGPVAEGETPPAPEGR